MEKARHLIVKALVSNDALQKLYELRQESKRAEGVRTRPAVLVSLALALVAVALLVATAWVPDDVRSYLSSRTNIFNADERLLVWETTGLVEKVDGAPVRAAALSEIDALVNDKGAPQQVLVRLKIRASAFDALKQETALVVSLPSFNYRRAQLYVNGVLTGTFLQGQRQSVTLEPEQAQAGELLTLESVMEVLASDRTLAGNRNQEGVLVATQGEFERYRDFLGAKTTNAAGAMGHLAKIVLALFCLLLFLVVDSSPESFGLALFMGLEAAAMGIGQGWMPLGFFGLSDHVPAIVNYFYQMGDILKLYFLFQMARVGGTSAMPWLVVGSALSLPYGFFMEWAGVNHLAWTYKIPRSRDTLVGTVGAVVCLRAVWMLRGKALPWRKAALVIAAIAAAFEVLNSWIIHSDFARVYPGMRTMFTVFQANCGYLFALSTFLNISTLENRVRSLTAAKARADAIEREMEIGQIVQKALLKPPELPEAVELVCHHEAALYVSGDTYYAHWDRAQDVVTFLVNDVTGHGVQAALKASACNVLAKTIWEGEPVERLKAGTGARLVELDRMTQKLLVEMNATPDFNSLCGAEFDLKSGKLAVYRSNFTFPIVIQPKVALEGEIDPQLGEFWVTELVASRNQEIVTRELRRGAFVVFMSDGFLESSRDAKQFTTYLRRHLAPRDVNVTVQALTEVIMRYDRFKDKALDDRTLMIFQFARKGAKMRQIA